MSKGTPTIRDFETAHQSELKKTYKMSDRQLEVSYRDHLYGSKQHEMRKEYEKFYLRKKK
jgi:hypothetical protein